MADEARVSRWYFGGLASCGAACCTHPLDLLKVSTAVGSSPAENGETKRNRFGKNPLLAERFSMLWQNRKYQWQILSITYY